MVFREMVNPAHEDFDNQIVTEDELQEGKEAAGVKGEKQATVENIKLAIKRRDKKLEKQMLEKLNNFGVEKGSWLDYLKSADKLRKRGVKNGVICEESLFDVAIKGKNQLREAKNEAGVKSEKQAIMEGIKLAVKRKDKQLEEKMFERLNNLEIKEEERQELLELVQNFKTQYKQNDSKSEEEMEEWGREIREAMLLTANDPQKDPATRAEMFSNVGEVQRAQETWRSIATDMLGKAQSDGIMRDSHFFKNIAQVYEKAGDREQAREYWLKAAENIDKELGSGNDHLNFEECAKLYEKVGETQKAKGAWFKKAEYLVNLGEDISMGLADAYAKAGELDKAKGV
ncbi:MAG TPA: hypothetical protein P5267_00430, partial [Patescibacteria group bacterium]|nr:hypothetical protein [Patescibacteria group bacterium]